MEYVGAAASLFLAQKNVTQLSKAVNVIISGTESTETDIQWPICSSVSAAAAATLPAGYSNVTATAATAAATYHAATDADFAVSTAATTDSAAAYSAPFVFSAAVAAGTHPGTVSDAAVAGAAVSFQANETPDSFSATFSATFSAAFYASDAAADDATDVEDNKVSGVTDGGW